MRVTDLIPWRSSRQDVASGRRDDGSAYPVGALDINRAFDGLLRAFALPDQAASDGAALPDIRVDVQDSEDAILITAELPGMDEEDVEVIAGDDAITIRGETEEEEDEDDAGYMIHERRIGLVERTIPLPDGVDAAQAEASFRNGVLRITVPKTADARSSGKRIRVQT